MTAVDTRILVRCAVVVLISALIGDLFLIRHRDDSDSMNVDTKVHVIVVGGGLAGLSSAISALDFGATNVTLLEKMDHLGGNSAKATSGINGWGTAAQMRAQVLDSPTLFAQDTFKSGEGGMTKHELVHALTDGSRDAVRWLSNLGVPLSVLSQLGGHSQQRTHRAPDKPDGTPTPIGFTIIQMLEKHLRTFDGYQGRISILTGVTVESLVQNDNLVSDVVFVKDGAKTTMLGDAIILATGGFSNDHTSTSLLNEFAPSLSTMPTTNGPFATGDGVKMGRAVGASLVDMDKIQLHPTAFINPKDPGSATKFLGPEALRGSGGILLNHKGERFVNELGLRSEVTSAIQQQNQTFPGSGGCFYAYCLLSGESAERFGLGALRFYADRMGLFRKVDDVASLASMLHTDETTITERLKEYDVSAQEGRCPLTGKTVFPSRIGTAGPFYIAIITPAIHYTMGGLEMTAGASLLHQNTRKPIPRLFGAGEVTGGLHGANRLGGNSLLECTVFGRMAGERAVAASRSAMTLSQAVGTSFSMIAGFPPSSEGIAELVIGTSFPINLDSDSFPLLLAFEGDTDSHQTFECEVVSSDLDTATLRLLATRSPRGDPVATFPLVGRRGTLHKSTSE